MEYNNQDQHEIQKKIQVIDQLSNMVLEQQKLIDNLENGVDELTAKVCKIKESTKSSNYSLQIFMLLCIVFAVAISCKSSY